jgi:hypothetical protein
LTVQLIARLFFGKPMFFDSSYFKKNLLLFSFFNDQNGRSIYGLLSEDDKEYLTEKNRIPVLELWLEYLYDTNIL